MSLGDKLLVVGVATALATLGCDSVAQRERREADEAHAEARRVKEQAERDMEQARRDALEKQQEVARKAAEQEAQARRAERDAALFGARLTQLVTDVDAGLDRLQVQGRSLGEAGRREAEEASKKLEARRAELERELDVLRATAPEKAKDLRLRLEREVAALQQEIDRVLQRLATKLDKG